MNESGWWSFLYFMGAGQERDWGESKVSQARNKPTPCQLGKARGRRCKTPRQLERQWVAKKKPPASWKKKQWVAKKRPPASWKKRQWVAKKNPPTLAGKDSAGSRSACARAKPKNNTQQRNKIILSPKEASASPPQGLKNTHTAKQKRC